MTPKPPTNMTKDFIVTLDVYVFGAENRQDAIDKAMAACRAGGLNSDALDAQEGGPDDTVQDKD